MERRLAGLRPSKLADRTTPPLTTTNRPRESLVTMATRRCWTSPPAATSSAPGRLPVGGAEGRATDSLTMSSWLPRREDLPRPSSPHDVSRVFKVVFLGEEWCHAHLVPSHALFLFTDCCSARTCPRLLCVDYLCSLSRGKATPTSCLPTVGLYHVDALSVFLSLSLSLSLSIGQTTPTSCPSVRLNLIYGV